MNQPVSFRYDFTLLVLLVVFLRSCLCAVSKSPLLIVVSFDGFRYDYLNKTDTPNFGRLAADGVRAPWIEARFITKTFPNHFSIATGLYEESHGIVANTFYDPILNDTFHLGDTDAKWWDTGAVPIWVSNQLAGPGRYSGGMMWPGTDALIRNQTTFHLVPYDKSKPYYERVDEVVFWLTNDTMPANCVFLYFEEPDSTGHRYGPDSPEVAEQIRRADNVTGYLIAKLTEADLFDKVNLIITSDHGMTDIPNSQVIDMSSFVDSNTYMAFGTTPVWGILPRPGKEEEVYNSFLNASKTMNFEVYKKEDIPEVYHYKNNRRIQPILVVSNEHWDIEQNLNNFYETPVHGNHGYNNSISSMHPFFIAHGPDFKKGYLSQPFRNIDIYPLACHLLGIKQRANNGSMENVRDLLRYPPMVNIDYIILIVLSIMLSLCTIAAIIAIVKLHQRRKQKNQTACPTLLSNSNVHVDCLAPEEIQSLMSSTHNDDT